MATEFLNLLRLERKDVFFSLFFFLPLLRYFVYCSWFVFVFYFESKLRIILFYSNVFTLTFSQHVTHFVSCPQLKSVCQCVLCWSSTWLYRTITVCLAPVLFSEIWVQTVRKHFKYVVRTSTSWISIPQLIYLQLVILSLKILLRKHLIL